MKWLSSLLFISALLVSGMSAADRTYAPVAAELESSGCAYLLSLMLKERAGLSVSEAEMFSMLLLHGDIENIAETKGFSLLDIKRAVGVWGLRVNAFRAEDLLLDLAQRRLQWRDGPYLILKDNPEGVDRFMLYYREDGDLVYLRDPFEGIVTVPRAEFNRLFVPYVVIIEGASSEYSEL